MRSIPLLIIILLSACETKKEAIINRQQAVKQEMEQVKASYYKKLDSLKRVMESDTNPAKQTPLAKEISSADGKRVAALLKLQKEFDSLELESKKD